MKKNTTKNWHFCIVTPSFNQARFLAQTMKSVLQQTGNVHYLVMDGGSTDGSVALLKKAGARVQWRSQKDHGQTDALNKGMRALAKELAQPNCIFAYINSDDFYLPGAFAKVAAAFSHNPTAKWVIGDCAVVDADGQPMHQAVASYKRWWRKHFSAGVLAVLNPIPQPATFIRAEALAEIGFFDDHLRYVMDYDYWWRLQKKFGPPLFLSERLAAFRIHQASKGGSQYDRQFAEQLQVVRRYVKNPVLLLAQQMHNWAITLIYRIIK